MKTIQITSLLRKCGKLPGFFLILLVLSLANGLLAQENPYGKRYYKVLSSSSKELVISITPEYKERTVTDNKTGEEYTQIDITGGTLDELTQGEPALEWFRLPILLPSNKMPKVEVVEAEIENIGVSLAPVPSYTSKEKQFVEVFEKGDSYLTVNTISDNTFASIRPQGTFRTSYSGELIVTPLRYDAKARVLSRVNKIVLRITYQSVASQAKRVSTVEESFFKSGFINGNVSEFYHNAVSQVAPSLPSHIAYKGTPQAGETWIAVKTTDEGVYRITAGNLQQYGVSSVDASTITLYGFGGMPLPEKADSATGEFQEVAIDVRTDGSGNFQELRFFAPGTTTWGYRSEFSNSKIFKLYHERNPYSANGMFYLKVGGATKGKRIATQFDIINKTPEEKNRVFTSYVYEKEERFEVPNVSREFLGEIIPLGRDVMVSIPSLPGYTADSVLIRPAIDARSCEASTINVKVNNSQLGIITPNSLNCSNDDLRQLTREWGSIYSLSSSVGMPQNFAFQATSNDKSSKYWLNFIEIFYLRKAELNDGQVPFMLFSDTSAYRFTFSNATTGEIWDVSDHKNINRVASASGTSMSADVVGKGEVLRRFIAFSDGNIKYPELSTLSAMKLRSGICQTGAQDIIITSEAFLAQAQKLAAIRERGGQATNPLTTAVVTVEDIYREFGYGTKDVTAIRDFLAYTLRSTIKNSSTVPLFATLFGNGHGDYMNRVVQLEQRVPVYETNNWASVTLMRKDYPDPVPDDAYFARLTGSSTKMDVAIGRVTIQTIDDAENFVRKTEKYETSSDAGSWRAKAVFITDDRYYNDTKRSDPINHLIDSENEVDRLDPRIIVDKLYSHVYPYNTISGGQRRKPDFEKQIVDAFNSGAVLISYAGHGNPNVWTNESVLTVPSTVNKFSNFNRLAFTTTATCDFSEFDNCNNPISGGVQTLTKPDGGCIGSLATSRSVYPGEELVYTFYDKLFDISCDELQGSNYVGFAYVAGRIASGLSYNADKFFILGDPAQRLLIPRQYVVIDSINGKPYNEEEKITELASLSVVSISGHISNTCDGNELDATFNGTSSVTLFDAPTRVEQVSTFTQANPVTDSWMIEGPILYRGSATVKNGRFSTSFIVPKDIKFDTNKAKIHMYASSNDFRSAVGVGTNIRVYGVDTSAAEDSDGPNLTVYIGSRRFRSGDVVPIHSKVIVDVKDISGINTSTTSIGHSFIGWANDSTSNVIDFAENYTAEPDDYSSGTSEKQTLLPKGHGVLNVRAFDARNNPTFASVDYIASDENPYKLYDVAVMPSPVRSTATFTFLQPSAPESPVDVIIDVYTVDGRKVKELSALNVSQNDIALMWDLRDMSGSFVPDAAYVYRISVNERLTSLETMYGGVFIVQRQ
jgi:hypothetical protein